MQLISGNKTLINQRLDNFTKVITGLRQSLVITQEETEQKFKKNWTWTLVTYELNVHAQYARRRLVKRDTSLFNLKALNTNLIFSDIERN